MREPRALVAPAPGRRNLPPLRTGLSAFLAVALGATCCRPQETAPPAFDASGTMRAVAALLDAGHVSGRPVDDEIAERAFRALFDQLDPQHLILLAADIDRLRPEQDDLDDYLRAGDDGFAQRVEKVYAQRLHEAAARAAHWLTVEPDFSVVESFSTDTDARGFAPSPEALDELWRRRVKLDRLALEYDGVAPAQVKERLQRRYAKMGEDRARPVEVTGRFLEAIASSCDPHTTYMTPSTAQDFKLYMRLNYEGIGAVLGEEDGRVLVRKVMDGSSARASGQVKAGDAILAVGQDDGGDMVSVDGLELQDVVDRIRGPRGTNVRLLLATGGEPPRTVVLQRRKTELQDQYATDEVLTEGTAKIGWIELASFYADPAGEHAASRDVAKLIADFERQKVGSIVLDLRANGGGLLTEAIALTGLFIDSGNVVRAQNARGEVARYDDPVRAPLWRGPLVVLTSRLSASASEIFAGAIKDQGRGLVVGDTQTHGKGTVQELVDLSRRPIRRGDHPSGTLKLTVQQFFRPDGDSTQRHGVRADVVLPAWTESVAEGEASLPFALPFRALAPVVESAASKRAPALLEAVAAASARRVAEDPDFAAVVRANEARAQARKSKEIPLERAAYAAFRTATKVTFIDDDPAKEPEFYRREVCKIAADYAARLAGAVVAVR